MWEKFGARKQEKRQDPALTQGQLNRRKFLTQATSIGASTLLGASLGGVVGESFSRLADFETWSSDRARRMRFERFGNLSPKERERIITAEVQQAHSFLNSQEGKRILESGTDDEIFTLLTSMPALLREHIFDTSYDIPKEKWPSVAIGVASTGEPFALSINYDQRAVNALCSGNGVFVAPDTMLTNWHVIEKEEREDLASPEEEAGIRGTSRLKQLYNSQNIDAVYVKYVKPVTLENSKSFPNIYPLSPDISDADVSGNLVTVASIDPDGSAAADGTKIYPSIAIPVTRRLRAFVKQYAGQNELSGGFIQNGFMYIAPPGECAPRPYPSKSGSRFFDMLRSPSSAKRRTTLIKGTSGSPVLMNGRLAGLNHVLGNIEYKGVGLDVGFFHGPDALHKARELGMELTILGKDVK